MRVIVAGGDGFCGWPSALRLSAAGHAVLIVDNLSRRQIDEELQTSSLTPIASLQTRVERWVRLSRSTLSVAIGDLCDPGFLHKVFREFHPDAVVHFAEQRSAPYSMIDGAHAVATQVNNVVGTLNLLFAIHELAPDCHLVKLGTMGEYGTPNIDIEEGYIEIEHNGRRDTVPYPKQPGSFYHLSKVHDSHNILFACRAWRLRATDLNQGVVYNTQTPETARDELLVNRFDYDGIFGTVLNRFCVQAVAGEPITIYGSGGQTRGFIDLRDTVACIELALAHQPKRGELRVLNQFTQQWNVWQLAARVKTVAAQLGMRPEIVNLRNPRVEAERHSYRARHSKLIDLGLKPHPLSDQTITQLLETAQRHRERIRRETITPRIDWRGRARGRSAPSNGIDASVAEQLGPLLETTALSERLPPLAAHGNGRSAGHQPGERSP